MKTIYPVDRIFTEKTALVDDFANNLLADLARQVANDDLLY